MLRFVPVIYLVLFGFAPAVWSAPFEEGAEFSRVEVQFATDSSGILIAYECSTCPPKNFIFNNKLRVLNSDGSQQFPMNLGAILSHSIQRRQ